MSVFGLIGFPLTHSFSQRYFTELFAREEASHRYELFPLRSVNELPGLLAAEPELAGLNVTIPYKEQVIPLLDELDASAASAGAVNVIRVQRLQGGAAPYRLTGYNTDTYGFRESIRPILRNNHQRALILGTGGAAKAVACVLRSMNIDFLFVSRNPAPGQVSYAELNRAAVEQFPFIINCTPAGMYPDISSCPSIPYAFLDERNFLYDLVYNPAETEFLARGKAKGALVMNGLDMLRLQAEKAWEIFRASAQS